MGPKIKVFIGEDAIRKSRALSESWRRVLMSFLLLQKLSRQEVDETWTLEVIAQLEVLGIRPVGEKDDPVGEEIAQAVRLLEEVLTPHLLYSGK